MFESEVSPRGQYPEEMNEDFGIRRVEISVVLVRLYEPRTLPAPFTWNDELQ